MIIKGEITNQLDARSNACMIHCVNCLGIMGTGVALGVRIAYPEVADIYQRVCSEYDAKSLFGSYFSVNIDNGNYVYNAFGQFAIGRDRPQLDLGAFENSLRSIAADIKQRGLESVLVPYGIGCGNAGGKWDVVRPLVESIIPEVIWVDPGNRFKRRS